MMNPITQNRLHELGLTGMVRALELQLQQTDMQRLSFEERLGMLLDAECSARNTHRIERHLKAAKLRYGQASLEEINYLPARKLEQGLVMSLADCGWIERRQNLIITGATGTGKSWLACAFAVQACRLGKAVFYTTSTQLFESLAMAQADRSLPRLRRQLIRKELLVIDDLGLGGIDPALGPTLLEIVDLQANHGSLLLTSQFPTDNWYPQFGDPTVADAILDRIVHRAHHIKLQGESMRKLKGKKS